MPRTASTSPTSRRGRAAMIALATLALAVTALAPRPALAGRANIKLATIAPAGSPWHNLLSEMGEQWAEETDGQVRLKIYGGGTQGAEGDVLRKMRVGQLHAATLTAIGLRDISDREVQTLQVPLLVRTPEELEHIWEVMGPRFEKTIEKNGYKVLNWGQAGWGRFFGKSPLSNPSQTKDFKVFTVVGDPGFSKALQTMGFNPIAIASTEMVPALKTDMINLTFASPIAALSLQWFHEAPHMSDFAWAPLVGGTVITKAVWDKIPAEHQATVLRIARETGRRTDALIEQKDREAVVAMKEKGLKVVPIGEADMAAWEAAAEKSWASFKSEDVVPVDVFDEIQSALKDFRAKQGAAKTEDEAKAEVEPAATPVATAATRAAAAAE